MKIDVLGFDRDGGQQIIAQHSFEFNSDGVVHYIDGTKRAEIPGDSWKDYMRGSDEARTAQTRLNEIKMAEFEAARQAEIEAQRLVAESGAQNPPL